jgi:molecular chaperone GrpE
MSSTNDDIQAWVNRVRAKAAGASEPGIPPSSETGASVSEPGIPASSERPIEEDPEVALEADLAEMAAERDELRDLAQRVQADFENYRKRMLREQTAIVDRANESLVIQLLPVLDSFELALASLDDTDPRVRKGVELVYAELLNALERAGVERIDTDGAAFDPEVHEAVLQDDGPGEPVVAETMRKGYRLKGRVLRPAMVKVAR